MDSSQRRPPWRLMHIGICYDRWVLTRKPLRAVLFDWDGTLLNSFKADTNAYSQMFRSLGISWDPAALSQHYSPDWHNVYRAVNLPPESWGEADRLWRRFYAAERPLLQTGARRVVQTLAQRFTLGLVSGGSTLRVRSQIRALGLQPLFSVAIFGDRVPRRKPHPLQLQLAIGQLGFEPACCVYIGDAPEDVKMARRAGVAVVGVIEHSPVPEKLRASRPNALVNTIAELPKLFAQS
ncbi:MAG TPA: HAD family hydrolase [Candidatus Acidoferrales bacterium]|nr:HAD family hydrolase [Candidatus Acidoferrales bacterium]